MIMRDEMLYTIRLFTVAAWFFLHRAESKIVCSQPSPPENGYRMPEKQFFAENENVSYKCSRRHYLFGNSIRTCLSSGQWSGDSPYCAKASNKVKLKENEVSYDRLMDGVRSTCLMIPDIHEPIYIQVNGFYSSVVVEILPEPYYDDALSYEVSFLNYSSEMYQNQDPCSQDSRKTIFICDFRTYMENPVIKIEINQEIGRCFVCRICEVNIFVTRDENSSRCFPPQIDNASWNDTYNGSYPIGTILEITCNEGHEFLSNIRSITCQISGSWSPLYCTETSSIGFSKVLIYGLTAGIFVVVCLIMAVVIFLIKKRKKREIEPKDNPPHCEVACDEVYETINEVRYSVHPIKSHHTVPDPQPVYTNELLEFSSSKSPSSDEEGYLVPTTIKHTVSSAADKDEGVQNQSAELNIYCTIPEISLKDHQSETDTLNIYENI